MCTHMLHRHAVSALCGLPETWINIPLTTGRTRDPQDEKRPMLHPNVGNFELLHSRESWIERGSPCSRKLFVGWKEVCWRTIRWGLVVMRSSWFSTAICPSICANCLLTIHSIYCLWLLCVAHNARVLSKDIRWQDVFFEVLLTFGSF